MAASFEGRTTLGDRGVEQAIVSLKKGAYVLKCGKRGKPKLRPFRLSPDERTLIWYSKEKEKHLSLNIVCKVVLGQTTVKFLRHRWPEKESQSLSLIYQNGKCSLDLICKDKDQTQSWYLALTSLVSGSNHPKPLANLRNSRQANSCASSPASYIRRKHQQEMLQRNSQARSFYGSPPRSIKDRLFTDSTLQCSQNFYSPRQRTLSDIQSYLKSEAVPYMPHKGADDLKDTANAGIVKEPRIEVTSDTIPPVIDKTNTLRDIFMWGDGIGYTLGGDNAIRADPSLPRLPESTQMLNVQGMACGERHAALITKQGEVFCWGEENSGRLGHKTNLNVSHPKIVESLANVRVQSVAFGSKHTCAATASGELYEWGDYTHVLSGDSAVEDKRSKWFPHRVTGPFDGIHVLKVACGGWHTAVISLSGQLFTYGDGTFGVLGHGNVQSVSLPKEVESLKGLRAKSVACGPWHTAAIVETGVGKLKSHTPAGKLFTWGDGDKGRLGHADTERKLLPTCVASLADRDFVRVSCGTTLTVALTITGVVFTMGSSMHGQLGNLRAEGAWIASVEGLLKTEFVKEISSGSFHVAALTSKGQAFTWGKGADGQLGLGDCVDRSSPALVKALENRHVESIACGSNFTAAICLHRVMSNKDRSICSGCQIAFSFTRKKHNCYNCGSVFCHSCSSKKVGNAAMAPNTSNRYRVCDLCFNRLKRHEENDAEVSHPKLLTATHKLNSEAKNKEAISSVETQIYTPKLSRVFKEKSDIEKTMSTQGASRQNQVVDSPLRGTAQRWGQVACPDRFSVRSTESTQSDAASKHQISDVSPAGAPLYLVTSKTSPLKSAVSEQDLHLIDKILSEEVKLLHAEATMLVEQCKHKSQKIQQYKRSIEETWLLSREEAAKCKAAKDIIKVLTNQINALSEKFPGGQPIYSAKSMANLRCTGTTLRTELPEPLKKITGIDYEHLDGHILLTKPRHNGLTPSSNAAKQQADTRTSQDDHNALDEAIEQIERGVYVTFFTLPGGKKGLKRLRFSRKHFGEKEAEQWWEENKSRVYMKYSAEEMVASSTR